MATTATTIREGHRYQLGPYQIWYEAKPGQGNRVAFFVATQPMATVRHIDRDDDSGDNAVSSD